MASLFIVFEYVSVPFPMVDARIPRVYERIGGDGDTAGSVWDVPLNKGVARYQYYQTVHRKRLLMGFGPRLHSVLLGYADTFPMVEVFKDPDSFLPLAWEWNRQDALRLIDFFNLDVVVIHQDYLQPGTVERLREFLLALFPVRDTVEEGNLIVFWMNRGSEVEFYWSDANYRWDFDPAQRPPFLFEGWASPESWDRLSVAWSNAKESRLWVYFPRREDVALELRILPVVGPDLAPQTLQMYVNDIWVGAIQLETSEWRTYLVRLPKAAVAAGMNYIRFVYRYTISPAAIIPGSHDTRALAVAYDYITFRRD